MIDRTTWQEQGSRWSDGWNRACARLMLAGLSLAVPPHLRRFLRRQTPYRDWLDVNRLTAAGLADLLASLDQAGNRLPRISVVMPLYRPDLHHFRSAVTSVREQVYQQWELCLCDDGSADPRLTEELRQLATEDSRIRLAVCRENGGISAATNLAAGIATGEVLLFLDQDDQLAEDCLAEFAIAFADAPDVDLAYSDSDKMDAKGRRLSPSFKPGWSPWLLLSYMYPSHAVAMRRALFERLGGLRSRFDGSQDYDLLLRASEAAKAVRHIPRVLYYWRVVPGSTALRADQKPRSIEAGQAALAEAVARRGLAAGVSRPLWAERAGIGLFECSFVDTAVSASLIVLPDAHRDPDPQWLAATIGSVPHSTEIVVVAPAELRAKVLAAAPQCRSNQDMTFVERGDTLASSLARACQVATRDIVVCLSAGCHPQDPDWFRQLAGTAARSGGVVGPRLLDGSGRVLAAGLVRPADRRDYQPAFAGFAPDRPGALYLSRVMHECAALPALCVALQRATASSAASSGSDVDNVMDLGVTISEFARRSGQTVLVAAHLDLEVRGELGTVPRMRAGLPDPFYNPNLGCDDRQHLPRLASPRLRQRNPVRLAVITHNLDREGAQTTLVDLLIGLRGGGHADPVVISSTGGALEAELSALGIPVLILNRPRRRASALSHRAYRAALVDVFRQTAVQAVLANTLDSYAAVNAASEAGLGTIWWQHEGGSWRGHFRRLRLSEKAMAYAAFGQSYRVVQVARTTRHDWLPVSTRDNFEVVRFGLPPNRLADDLARWTRAEARSALAIDDETCSLLLLGSVSPRKSQADVIAAIRLMNADQVRKVRVLIVGAFAEPRYHAELERMVAALPPAHRAAVSLCGSVPDTAKYFSAADIFLCCSKRESAPRSVVEAMAFGLPVLTTPVDGIPELVENGRTGLFFETGNPADLVAKIGRLAQDVELREQLGRNGRSTVAEISNFDGMVERFGNLIREAAWQGRLPADAQQDRRRS